MEDLTIIQIDGRPLQDSFGGGLAAMKHAEQTLGLAGSREILFKRIYEFNMML